MNKIELVNRKKRVICLTIEQPISNNIVNDLKDAIYNIGKLAIAPELINVTDGVLTDKETYTLEEYLELTEMLDEMERIELEIFDKQKSHAKLIYNSVEDRYNYLRDQLYISSLED